MFLSLSRVLEYIDIRPELEICTSEIRPETSQSSFISFLPWNWFRSSRQEPDSDVGDIESAPLLSTKTSVTSYQSNGDPSITRSYLSRPAVLKGDHLTVGYQTSLSPVLVDLSFILKGGKIIGLSGRTGGGKVQISISFCQSHIL